MWKNRIVPALLALCMVLALLPATVFAEETTVTDKKVSTTQQCACYETTDGGNTTHSKTSGDGAVQCATTQTVEVTVSYTYDSENDDQDAIEEEKVAEAVAALDPWYCADCAAELGGGNGGGDEETMICKVMDCSDYNLEVGVSHTHNYACHEGKDNSSQAVCNKNEGHEPDCAQRCQKGDCDLTKGHDEGANGSDHNSTVCTVDAHCTASDNHLKGCAFYEAAPLDPGTDGLTAAEAVDVTGTVYIPCTCGGFHHDENFNHVVGDPNNCGNYPGNGDHKGVGISVTVSFDYPTPRRRTLGLSKARCGWI